MRRKAKMRLYTKEMTLERVKQREQRNRRGNEEERELYELCCDI
jgi:hypothetical protein